MSQDRIIFYEQVLELEPASKLFFTLARLYYEHDEHEKARTVLESGLEKHPEHVQARLLLAEVMESTGDIGAARLIYRDVFNSLFNYPEFWSGLAAGFQDEGNEGPALAANFLSHWIQDPSLSWVTVMQTGIQSLPTSAPSPSPSVPAEPDESVNSAEHTHALKEDTIVEAEQDFTQASLVQEDEVDLSGIESAGETPQQQDDSVQPDLEPGPTEEPERQPSEAGGEMEELTPLQDNNGDLVSAPDEQPPLQQHDEAVRLEQEEEFPDKQDRHQSESVEMDQGGDEVQDRPDAETDSASPEEEYDEPEEVDDISFEEDQRTRSMADLLAAQEEYLKALDIYRELWIRSLPGPERRELEEIISVISRTAGLEEHSEKTQGEETAPIGVSAVEVEETTQEEPDRNVNILGAEDDKVAAPDIQDTDKEAGVEEHSKLREDSEYCSASPEHKDDLDKKAAIRFLSRLADRLESKTSP